MLCKDGGLNEKLGVYIDNEMETIQFRFTSIAYLAIFSVYSDMSVSYIISFVPSLVQLISSSVLKYLIKCET